MDAMLFAAKRVHLSAVRVGRRMLARFGLTPARFDVLYLVDSERVYTQADVWRALGLARATICEMLGVLEEGGLIARVDEGRTRSVTLTKRGRAALDAAYAAFIGNGLVTCALDAAVTYRQADVDPAIYRAPFAMTAGHLMGFFGDTSIELYPGEEDFVGCIADPHLENHGVPWVSDTITG